ncbi:ribonuclease T2 family protein [Pseudorhizobium flavum]|uniref:Ribonuclease T2 n=1 Tax=Pseudorhizobium flavum TaxID=1335061 RepID=A0A7W9YVD1_9HYPH|nr:ribonuclease [Pseudorhizobium flavum]MBB6179063.1 ribonuclease T2 [Pseudorhizobium flavum]CAD6603225.1 ribonuclease [Pseudorhizobium flavum]
MDQPFHIRLLPIAILLLFSSASLARSQSFDFYVLSLSWSPTYCATQKRPSRSPQCSSDEEFRFVVHGLWPQHERGYPEYCRSQEPQRVPRSVGNIVFDIMPSMGLIGHQWRKHGSCSGLTQRGYFDATRQAFERIQIPPKVSDGEARLTLPAAEIERSFVAANPGMSTSGIAISCEGQRLKEIRICLTKEFRFRDCAEVDRGGCRLDRVELPPAE